MRSIYAEKLELQITLIGYGDVGEAILFCIMLDGVPFFCGVIDCYRTTEKNLIIEEIKNMGIKSLDLIVWSHPHEDHSLGLEDLIPYINQDTLLCLSSKCYQYSDVWRSSNQVFFEFCENEKRKRLCSSNIQILETTAFLPISHSKVEKIRFLSSETIYDFALYAFSPDPYNLGRLDYREGKDINEFSIGLILQLGEATVVFASDVPNTVFDRMKEGLFPEYVDYLKIPHHGSETSIHILNHINCNIDTSCSTIFSRYDIPDHSSRNLYASRTREFFLTGRCGQSHNVGIVRSIIDATGTPKIKTELFGEALSNTDY